MKSIHSPSGLPASLQRKEILLFESASRGLGGDVDFDFVARQTFGLTGPDLAQVVERAALASRSNGSGGSINTSDLMDGVRSVAISPNAQGSIYGPREKKKMAFAAAASAVVSVSFGRQSPERLCIFSPAIPPSRRGAERPDAARDAPEVPEDLVILVAGTAAEKLFFGDPDAAISSAAGRVGALATTMNVVARPKRQIRAAERCARDVVSTYRSHVETIANRLEDQETLAGPHLESMLEAVRREAELFGPPCSLPEPRAASERRSAIGH